MELEPKLKERAESSHTVAELIEISRALEGLNRHASTHAAGVVIGDKPLVEYLPLYKGKRGEVLTQYDMKMVEKIGLVKFDFLGLRNLTIMANTLDIIAAQGHAPPDLANLPVGPGIEDVYYSCTWCHSAQTFAQQRLTDARWEYLWDWMIQEQGMPDYGPESREIILEYLTTHFSSER